MTISTWLGHYAAKIPAIDYSDAASVGLDEWNQPQPDLLLRLPESHGGHSRITDAGYLEGPPELIVEVAASSASYDLHDKLETYRQSGVQEYLVWRVLDNSLDWFELQDGQYVQLSPDSGILKSRIFPGLWLNVAALLEFNLAQLFETIDASVRSPQFASFATALHTPPVI